MAYPGQVVAQQRESKEVSHHSNGSGKASWRRQGIENHLRLPSSLPILCLQLEGGLHPEREGEEGHPVGPTELLSWPPTIILAESPGPNQPSLWTLGLLESLLK